MQRIVDRPEPLVDTCPAPSLSQHVHVRLERQSVLVAFLLNALAEHLVSGVRAIGEGGWFDDLLVRIAKIKDVVEFVVFAFQCLVEQGSLHEVFAFFPISRRRIPQVGLETQCHQGLARPFDIEHTGFPLVEAQVFHPVHFGIEGDMLGRNVPPKPRRSHRLEFGFLVVTDDGLQRVF